MEQPTQDSWMTFGYPADREVLIAFGKLTMAHGHLDYALRTVVMTLAEVTKEQALDATSYDGAASLRERIKKLAKNRLGESSTLVKVQALMSRCERVTKKRNEFIHSLWGRELDGDSFILSESQGWKSIPESSELNKLVGEIEQLRNEIISARMEGGFLYLAINKK